MGPLASFFGIFLRFFPTCHPFPSHPGNEIRSTAQAVPSWGTGRVESDWALAAAKGSRRVLQEDPAAWVPMGSPPWSNHGEHLGNQWVFIVGTSGFLLLEHGESVGY